MNDHHLSNQVQNPAYRLSGNFFLQVDARRVARQAIKNPPEGGFSIRIVEAA